MQESHPRKPWFLAYEEDGRPVIRWRVAFMMVTLIGAVQAAAMFLTRLFARLPTGAFSLTLIGVVFIPLVTILVALMIVVHDREMMKYRGETPRFRFDLRVVFLVVSGICLWLGVTRLESEQTRKHYEQRVAFAERCGKLVGEGKARYSGGTNELMIVVRRSDFDDGDFRELVNMLAESPDAAYIYYLDLSGTKITDESLSLMSDWSGLKYLSLDETEITDDGVRNVGFLPQLRSCSVGSTSVSKEVMKKIGAQRKQKNLPPFG